MSVQIYKSSPALACRCTCAQLWRYRFDCTSKHNSMHRALHTAVNETHSCLPRVLRKQSCPLLLLLVKSSMLQFLAMLAHSSEFENVAVREEELPELDELCLHQCPFDVKGGPENKHGKVNILLQVMPHFTFPALP